MSASRFPIIPEGTELASVPRVLRFVPCENPGPRALSTEDVERFNERGYVFPLRVFDDDEARAIRESFDELLARTLAEGRDAYSISSAHLSHGRVYDLLAHPRIVAYVRDLIGDDVIGWGAHFFCKLPGDDRTASWHQDASYWPLTPSGTVTVWLAIDDADSENACMRFLPGSHLHGHLPYRDSDASERNVLDQTVDAIEAFGEPVEVPLRAGDISLHSDLLLHGSPANRSDRRRCGLTLRYCPASVRAHLGWNAKGVVVAGRDESGHWANPPRPARE